ncbi:major capsid protein [Nocardia sp. NRRL WC-3656]|uniref:major capsid protein n=1 Tax=Nocardia sp. NRRL WC-3656 TaxID=1463824 RepID=UPI0004C45A89|nr:major capsid protein [Nocardia sp. NRRL WC-3656]
MPTAPNYSLSPQINGRNLTVDYVLKTPNYITNRIAALAADQLVIDKFLAPSAQAVTGGAILFTPATAAEMYTSRDLEQRGPGDEYAIVNGDRPNPQLAPVEDWGGKFFVTDENRIRNNISDIDDSTTQLTNTIVRKINKRTIDAVESAIAKLGGSGVVPGHDWSNVITVGDPTTLTPNAARPAADWANAQLVANMEELGYKFDTLVLNPQEENSLRIAYGENLAAVLESAGITTVFATPRVTAGTGYVTQFGMAGVIGFELTLRTEAWRDEAKRGTWVQAYAVPAIAITRPSAVKKLTGLAGA